LDDVGLMEDRATLRISCTVLQNWLEHGVVTWDRVEGCMLEMAPVVDSQNAGDALYEVLVGGDGKGAGEAWECALALVRDKDMMKNGYTEVLLTKYRLQKKRA
jgi:malate synthase